MSLSTVHSPTTGVALMLVFNGGFTPQTMIELLEFDIRRYERDKAARRTKLGDEFLRGKIVALQSLKWALENCIVREPAQVPAQVGDEPEFPEGVYWENRE